MQQQQQHQHHGYMHQTSMSSVRSVTSPPHSATMVGSHSAFSGMLWVSLNLNQSDPKTDMQLALDGQQRKWKMEKLFEKITEYKKRKA